MNGFYNTKRMARTLHNSPIRKLSYNKNDKDININ